MTFDDLYRNDGDWGGDTERADEAKWYSARGLRVPVKDDEFAMILAERQWFDAKTQHSGRIEKPLMLDDYLYRWQLPAGTHGAIMSLYECVMVKLERLGYWETMS